MLYLLERSDREHRFVPAPNTALRPAFLQWLVWGLTSFELVLDFRLERGDPLMRGFIRAKDHDANQIINAKRLSVLIRHRSP